MSNNVLSEGKTIVTTVKGEVKFFSDWLSRFVVAHPRWSAVIFSGLGFLAGWGLM
jgi:hypothetical protein